ncbi:MAG: flagellar biosynthetic protein FliO [Nitrospinota bacterium]
MKRITIILSVITALFAVTFPAAAAEPSTFKNLTAYTSSGGFSLVFAFEGKPVERLRFSENHIQIDFSSSRMSTPKKIYDIGRSGIGTVEVAQSSPETVRVRIKPSGDIKALGRSLSLEKSGGKLILRFASAASAAPIAQFKKSIEKAPKRTKGRVSSLDKSVGGNDKPPASASTLERPDRERVSTELKTALSKTSLSVAPDKKGGNGLFSDYSEPEVPAVPSLGESLVKVGGALAVVLAMVLILAFAAKRYLAGAETALGTKKQLKVLSSHFIGVKKSVTLVEIAGEILALGVTNENINLLARYDDPEKIERIKLTHRLPDRPMGIFKRLPGFSRISGNKAGKKRAFKKEMGERARAMKEREKKLAAKRDTAREELVSKAADTIASRLRKLENAAG